MNILVTGGCGFIGSNFINYILNKDVKIFNIDCLNYCANEKNVVSHPNYKFIKGNITSKDLVLHILNEYDINYIVHFARFLIIYFKINHLISPKIIFYYVIIIN